MLVAVYVSLVSLCFGAPSCSTTLSAANCSAVADSNSAIIPISPNAPDRREVDPVSSVRAEHSFGVNPLGVSDVEWKARTEAAALHRALYLYGMGSDLAAQCVMHRIPDSDEWLMGEWGVYFEEQTASKLLKYDMEGNIVLSNGMRERATPGRSNVGCIPIPPAIIAVRPEVQTIIHVHPISVMAVGGLKSGLLPLSQAAFFLYDQVSRESYDFTYEGSFESSLQKGFSNGKRAMLLNHHGMYAVGRDAAEAFFVAKHVTQACDVQVNTLAMAGGNMDNVILPDAKMLEAQYKDMMLSTDYSYDGSREWSGLLRELSRKAPDYNS
eukprot:TRINITY_DN4861_c0_g2_i3.p1 TRINITY_DN4861_c0_g2~~TRINITY_DN4861_c0_g2_i3.p1  ORF type:complete len:325 (-),score=25.81 TRINITY_DN4861_c0_g2_i3:205-1179(-)